MTESDWLTGTDYAAMTQFVAERLSARRQRLLAAAFCRAAGPLVSPPELLDALVVIERAADGTAPPGAQERARQTCRELAQRSFEVYAQSDSCEPHVTSELAWAIAFAANNPLPLVAVGTRVATAVVEARTGVVLMVPVPGAEFAAANAAQARVMRGVVWEVAGNPFRRTDFAPWRTGTAVALARQMYERREFSAMPILADALQDAGCDDDDVLRHCRDACEHVRGCWVVDGVLGRE